MLHEKSASRQHCLNVCIHDDNVNAVGTPTLDDFKKVKDLILRDCSIRVGLDGVGGRNKVKKMVICLFEGLKMKKQKIM